MGLAALIFEIFKRKNFLVRFQTHLSYTLVGIGNISKKWRFEIFGTSSMSRLKQSSTKDCISLNDILPWTVCTLNQWAHFWINQDNSVPPWVVVTFCYKIRQRSNLLLCWFPNNWNMKEIFTARVPKAILIICFLAKNCHQFFIDFDISYLRHVYSGL